MDPDLKALTRGMKTGSREYQATVNKYMAEKAAREGASADRAARIQREQADADAQRREAAAQSEALRGATERAAQEERDRNTSMITAGSAAGGLAGGFAGGKYADTVANSRADSVLSARAAELRNAAASARAINPNSASAVGQFADVARGVERSGAMRPRVVPVGTGALALGMLGLGAYSNLERAPNAKSDQERALWTGSGYGEMGAGVKMLADSARRYVNPGVTLPAADIAAIEGAARMGAGGKIGPVAPPADAEAYGATARSAPAAEARAQAQADAMAARIDELRKMRGADLKDQARALGLPVSGVKSDLASRIAGAETAAPRAKPRTSGGKAGFLLPLAAGGMAYDAASNNASAAGANPGEAAQQGLTAGLGAAGVTAAVPYAISKLPAAIGTAARAAGSGAVPSVIDAMTDYSPDDLAVGRNALARNLPGMLRGGAVENAYQMAQVPSRNPERDALVRAMMSRQ
jgi:hypothetical protein